MDPGARSPLKRQGSSIIEKSLSGLSDFGRSLNLSVLEKDPSLRKAYAAAQTDGQLPANRARVLILGEPRAGKTSLLNRLLGRNFDIREPPTEGIETRMCHVTNVNKQWNEGARADDIQECASAVTVLGEISSNGSKDVNNNIPTKTPCSSETPDCCTAPVLYLMKVAAQLMLAVIVVFTLGMFQYGYVVFVWCSIAAMSLLLDYNNAYRFATSISLVCALFEAMIRTDQPVEELACKADDDGSIQQALGFILKKTLFNMMNTVMVGVANGLGFRTGIAVAFSACVHPAETKLTLESALRGLKISWNMFVLSGIFGTGGVIGLGSYSYCTDNDRLHKTRAVLCCAFIALLLGVFLERGCSYRPYLFIFLNGYVMTTAGTWGAMFGRRAVIKYGFEASYVTKKTVGFIFGLYLAHACGWVPRIPKASFQSFAFYVLSVTAHPLFDLHITYRIWRAKPVYPVKVIRKHMKAMVKGQPLLETKLSLWDFAGDTLYHCTHHVFMPDRALYLIVFNLEAAVSDTNGQLQKLLFWLHSVCAHARHPDAVVIIVGTHTASVSAGNRLRLTDELHRRITSPFCHRLVLNPSDDKPLFLVENSDPLDRDFQLLRAEIFRRVESAEYAQERYPIKYMHFYREIQNRRKLAEVDRAANVMALKQVRDVARETCNVTGEDDLKSMLQFFCEAGEIIHKDDDEVLRQHVVLDPQFLVDVMKELLRIPRPSNRCHRFAVDWRDYESSGIITEGLLRHIYGNMSHLLSLLAHLLQAYDLMCPVAPTMIPDYSQKFFLVPAMLPPFRGDSLEFWKPVRNEEVFYFDFGLFDPSTVYHRLLTRCLTHASLDKIESNSKPLIFADRCRFHIGTSFIFMLQLERRASQQMLLSVTVLAFEHENPVSKLLKFLLNIVRSLIARDYPHLCFTFGPMCPFCVYKNDSALSSEDLNKDSWGNNNRDEAKIHVLEMAGHDKPFPTKSPIVILCGQNRHELRLSGCKSPGISQNRGLSHPPHRVEFTLTSSITKLAPDLFDRVCSLLDLAGTRNWKTLAGELGKDAESVAVLNSERVTNPTERLLWEWAMMSGNVTVGDLLEVLGRSSLQRMDIIQEIRSQMGQD